MERTEKHRVVLTLDAATDARLLGAAEAWGVTPRQYVLAALAACLGFRDHRDFSDHILDVLRRAPKRAQPQ